MEKETISKLVIAGGGVLVALIQVFVLKAARRKRQGTELKAAAPAEKPEDA